MTRKNGYYWITNGYYWITNIDGSNLCIGLWKDHYWFLPGFVFPFQDVFEVLGKVADWDGSKMS